MLDVAGMILRAVGLPPSDYLGQPLEKSARTR
jgi:hypothetical protein